MTSEGRRPLLRGRRGGVLRYLAIASGALVLLVVGAWIYMPDVQRAAHGLIAEIAPRLGLDP